jgi:hypothetical protein
VVVVVARAPEKTFPFCSAALPLPLHCFVRASDHNAHSRAGAGGAIR